MRASPMYKLNGIKRILSHSWEVANIPGKCFISWVYYLIISIYLNFDFPLDTNVDGPLMRPLSNYLSINAGLENLTDQRYRPYSSGLVAPGRNLIVSVRATF